MSRITYVNGAYLPTRYASVSTEDRAFQFSDGVYEVITVYGGKLIDAGAHLDRLIYSLQCLRIDVPVHRNALPVIIEEVRRQNRLQNGLIYIQISRGTATRDHPFPKNCAPTLVISAKAMDIDAIYERAQTGVKASFEPDQRWTRRDIKSTSLLANVLAKQSAREKGCFEAILVDKEGYITEGSSTNIWIVTQEGQLQTRPLSHDILKGITRGRARKLLADLGFTLLEAAFTPDDVLQAAECFLTSATGFVMPIVEVDGKPIGNGTPGPKTRQLNKAYRNFMQRGDAGA